MDKAKIIFLTIAAACGYGSVHDQITIRVCLEYFTIAHPRWFPTESPTLLAICWGIVATVGLGAVLGWVLALVAQSGSAEPWPPGRLVRPILRLLATMGLAAMIAGTLGFSLAARGMIGLPAGYARAIPESMHHRFMAVWFAHTASYLAAAIGGTVLCYAIWKARGRPRVLTVLPQGKAGLVRAAVVAVVAVAVLWFRFKRR